MNTEQTPPQKTASARPLPPPPKTRRRYIPHLTSWIVGALVVLMLAGVTWPFGNTTCIKGAQTKSLAQAKQIGLALKVFAGDHEGVYPRAGMSDLPKGAVNDANAAFAMLFPQYVASETIFGNKLSVYQTRQPDNVIDPAYTGKPVKTLEPGENVYAYVAGLTDGAPENTPLVVDGTDGTGHYTTDAKKRGGLWEGKRAIVIHLDNSGTVETLVGPEHARYVQRHDAEFKGDKGNLLDVSGVGAGVRLLDPAVTAR